MSDFKLTSPVFSHEELIPRKYTCQGENVNPELHIHGTPEETQSLVLIMDDPDAPIGTWVHWVVYNIAPTISQIFENSVPSNAVQGRNSWKRNSYGGPCPPLGTHHYYFKLYALDTVLNLPEESTKKVIEEAMKGHILAVAVLVGKYKKTN